MISCSFLYSLLLWILIFVAGCTPRNKTVADAGKKSGAVSASGLIVLKKCQPEAELHLYDTLICQFPEYPGRGYSWISVQMDSAQSAMKPAGIKRFSLKDMDDAEQTAEFRFIAEKKGTASLKFIYSRPWEKTKPALDSCSITIFIR